PELLAAQPGEHRLVAPGRVVGAGRRGRPGGRGRGRFRGGARRVVALADLLRHEVVEELLGLVTRDGHRGLPAVAQLRPAPAVAEVHDEPPGAALAEFTLVDLARLLLAELQGRRLDQLHRPGPRPPPPTTFPRVAHPTSRPGREQGTALRPEVSPAG